MLKRIISNGLFLVFIIAIANTLFLACNTEDKDIPPSKAYIKMPVNGFELQVGDSLILEPKITYNTHSSYTWYQNDEIISRDLAILVAPKKLGKEKFIFVVENNNGSDSLHITINTILQIDFNDFAMKVDTFIIGSANNAIVTKGLTFSSFVVERDKVVEPDSSTTAKKIKYNDWAGFALSNLYSPLLDSLPNNAYTPKASNNNFLIFHQNPKKDASSFQFENNQNRLIGSIDLCNNTLAYTIIRSGHEKAGIKKFGGASNTDADWFAVTITGYNSNGELTGEKLFYLADYRDANNRNNYIIQKWTKVDLRELGLVNKITFTLNSSVKNEEGEMLTPPYLCLDNIKILE